MAVKLCYVCELPVERGDARTFLGSLILHEECDPELRGKLCDTDECAWRWTDHGGACIV